MSKKSAAAKVEFILSMIVKLEKIISRHNGIVKSLEDFEGQMAILMAIAQIGETLKKLPNDLIQRFELKNDVEGAYYTRNYIVHDYEGIDLVLIEDLLRIHLPKLKQKLEKMLQELL